MSGISNITVSTDPRLSSGKGPARRIRAEGKIPAVVYGPSIEGQPISVHPKDVQSILSAPQGRNTVVTLQLAGASQLALLKSYEYHPVTRAILHADFYAVALDRPVLVQVPFVLVGKARGVASEGGTLRQIFRTLPVLATPDKIPTKIEYDVTNLGVGETVHVRDLVLPDGLRVKLDGGQTVANLIAPEKEVAVAAEAVKGAPAGKAAKGAKAPAAAAPAAKAPAAKKK